MVLGVNMVNIQHENFKKNYHIFSTVSSKINSISSKSIPLMILIVIVLVMNNFGFISIEFDADCRERPLLLSYQLLEWLTKLGCMCGLVDFLRGRFEVGRSVSGESCWWQSEPCRTAWWNAPWPRRGMVRIWLMMLVSDVSSASGMS